MNFGHKHMSDCNIIINKIYPAHSQILYIGSPLFAEKMNSAIGNNIDMSHDNINEKCILWCINEIYLMNGCNQKLNIIEHNKIFCENCEECYNYCKFFKMNNGKYFKMYLKNVDDEKLMKLSDGDPFDIIIRNEIHKREQLIVREKFVDPDIEECINKFLSHSIYALVSTCLYKFPNIEEYLHKNYDIVRYNLTVKNKGPDYSVVNDIIYRIIEIIIVRDYGNNLNKLLSLTWDDIIEYNYGQNNSYNFENHDYYLYTVCYFNKILNVPSDIIVYDFNIPFSLL